MKYKFPFLLLVLLGLFCSTAYGQAGSNRAYKMLSPLKKTKTLVVLDDEASDYNEMIRKSMEKFWTLTEIEYIPYSKLDDYLPNGSYSMMVKNNRMTNATSGNLQAHNDISLMLCNNDNLAVYRGTDEIATINLEDINDLDAYLYKLPGLIRAMNHYFKFIQEGNYDKASFLEKQKKYFNAQRKSIAGMTLLVPKGVLPEEIDSQDAWDKNYKYEVEVVDKADITTAILEEKEATAFLHVHAYYRKLQVISCETGEILYSAKPKEYKKVTAKDIKKIK